MSLLMDALRKAELAKQQMGKKQEAPPPAAALDQACAAPAPTAPAAPTPRAKSPSASARPGLTLHLEALDSDLSDLPPSAARTLSPPSVDTPATAARREETERTAARNVFVAKQTAPVKARLRLFLGLLGAAALGIGGYVWWQLQTLKASPLNPGKAPLTQATRPPPAALIPPSALALPAPAAPSTELAASATPRPPPRRGDALPSAASALVATSPRTAVALPPLTDSSIRLSRSPPLTNPLLGRAYDALQGGRLAGAREDYAAVLQSDPKNADALLGLASIAGQQGKIEQAENYYALALEADPRNVEAQSAQLNLKAPSDPLLAESQLKNLLASQPDAPSLNFVLGNLYARQSRWNEAQQAYFRASGAQPENADYLFNLAVSLEHLRQPRLAAQYYQTALYAAETHGSGIAFDRAQVQRRIQELLP